MKDLGTYEIKNFSKVRQILGELYEVSAKRTSVIGLIELDVDKARQEIERYQKETGIKLSFTGWLIKCISQAVFEHKEVHTYRIKKNKIIVYDNVHVSVMVERASSSGKKVPITHVITNANKKSVFEITNEIREVQQKPIKETNQFVEGTPNIYIKMYSLVPKFIRKKVFRKLLNNTQFFIENTGTVGVTALGMFSKNITGWPIHFTSSTLSIAIGGIKKKPVLIDEKITEHDFLNLTMLIDHTIVDGAPAARFVSRLAELVETGYGLETDSM